MMIQKGKRTIFLAFVLALASGVSFGAGHANNTDQKSTSSGSSQTGTTAKSDDAADAVKHVDGAVQVVKRMESDQRLKTLMQQAKGVFIVPTYGRAGLIVGGQGGAGVLVAHRNGKWSDPVFYDIGGVSIGAQAGAAAGPIAMLLMNEKALDNFMKDNNFSLNADAGLSIVNYSASAQGEVGKGDVIVWSGTKGAFAGVNIGVTDIHFDGGETKAYYKQNATPQDIIVGKVTTPQAKTLRQALPG